ncbi:MAG: phosphotransferase [Chloroflexi bacterium]|nr:phosphotransferase [Chloroflexota bacterium]
MQPSWHNDPELPYEYHLLIAHPSLPRVLLMRKEGGWRLPSFVPEERDFRVVGHINEAAHTLVGTETFVRRCLRHHYDLQGRRQYRVYLLTCREGDNSIPDDCRWFGLEDLPEMGEPDHLEVVERWLNEAEGSAPDGRAPWCAAGWLDDAATWIGEQLKNAGVSQDGPIEQLRSWSLSCLLRLPTSEGDVYFKAVPSFFRGEPAVMRSLSERYPDLVPPPLAVDVQKGWTLMSDFGGKLLGSIPEVDAWEKSTRAFSRLQVEQSKHVDSWIELGCPDRGLKTLAGMIDTLFQDSDLLMLGAPWGITHEELGRLRAMSLRLKLMCARLADYKVPHSLVHGDLGGNVVVKGDGFVFFDWTDACISHPFIDTATIVSWVFDEMELPTEIGELRVRVRDAYLEPWSEFEPMDRLLEAFEVAQPLGALHQAMTYAWLTSSVAEDARWEVQAGLVVWLRNLLKMMDGGSG